MHLFISYAKRDTRDFARELVDALRQRADTTAFMDEGLQPVAEWAQQLEHQIDRCDLVIVLLSPDVNRPRQPSFVLNEVQYALNLNKPIMLVMVEATPLPLILAGYQYFDVTSYASSARKIAAILEKLDDLQANPVALAPHPPRLTSQAESRRLEAAMPQKVKQADPTEVWVKIVLPESVGLRGELPEVTPAGDMIQKEDVRGSSFPLEFPMDERTGKLKAAQVCVEVVSDDFAVSSTAMPSAICEGNSIELEVPPRHDSRTIVFTLTPHGGRLGRSRAVVNVYQGGRLVAQTSVATEIVGTREELVVWGMSAVPLSMLVAALAQLASPPQAPPAPAGGIPRPTSPAQAPTTFAPKSRSTGRFGVIVGVVLVGLCLAVFTLYARREDNTNSGPEPTPCALLNLATEPEAGRYAIGTQIVVQATSFCQRGHLRLVLDGVVIDEGSAQSTLATGWILSSGDHELCLEITDPYENTTQTCKVYVGE